MKRVAVFLAVGVGVAAVLWASTSIKTAGNIETAEQLVSTKATGPPLVVSSTHVVANLNADTVDGNHSGDFAGATETAAELVDPQNQITAVQNQDRGINATEQAR